MADFKVGQSIELNDGRKGAIRFIGSIHVAEGEFIGVELYAPGGKNDGSVQGERYFSCAPGHGLFVRASGIANILAQAPQALPSPPKAPPKARPTSFTKAPAKTAVRSPPVAQAAKNPAPALTKPRTTSSASSSAETASTAAAKRITQQPVVQPPTLGVSKLTTSTKSASSTAPPLPGRRKGSLLNLPPRTSRTTSSSTTSSSAPPAPPSRRVSGTTRDTNVETLETKLRLVEKQRVEERDQLKELDQLQKEKTRFEGLIQKLQAKCQSFHTENSGLKEQIKEIQSEVDRLGREVAENDSILELATLDREMAEERAEAAEGELEIVRQKLEECELELDILRSEAEMGLDDADLEQGGNAAFFALQRENERVKEALMRLHDMTKTIEKEDKQRISELEKDLEEFDRTREENLELRAQILSQDDRIEHLKAQLDAAMEWEDMVEELSGQNHTYKEQLVEKDLEIQDLQKLKEICDELEEQHLEAHAELEEELRARELELEDQGRLLEEQEAAIADQDILLVKFRGLVSDLQTQMSTLESSKAISEEQAREVTGRFHDVMDLNRRLRHATASSTTKTIETELDKISIREYSEEREIFSLFFKEDTPEMNPRSSEAVKAYFQLKRIEGKAALLKQLLQTRNEESDDPKDRLCLSEGVELLNSIEIHAKQLWHSASVCTPEQLAQFSSSYGDSQAVERMLDLQLKYLPGDELKYEEINSHLVRCDKTMRDLGFTHAELDWSRVEFAPVKAVTQIKSHLETIMEIFEIISYLVKKFEFAQDEDDDGQGNVKEVIFAKIEDDSKGYRECVVLSNKLLRVLHILLSDSLYPDPLRWSLDQIEDHRLGIENCAMHMRFAVRDLIDLCVNSAGPIPFHEFFKQYVAIEKIVELGPTGLGPIEGVATKLQEWHEQASDLANCVEFENGPAPWVIRAKELDDAKYAKYDAEEKLQRLTEDHHKLILQMKEREDDMETKELEVEHLRAKVSQALEKAEERDAANAELSRMVSEREEMYQEISRYQFNIKRLERQVESMQKAESAAEETPVRAAPQEPLQAETPKEYGNKGFMVFLEALKNENHWLRQRENSKMFSITLGNGLRNKHTPRYWSVNPYRRERVAEQKEDEKASRMLSVSLRIDSPLRCSTPEFGSQEKGLEDDFSSLNFTSSTPMLYPPTRDSERFLKLKALVPPLKWVPGKEMPKRQLDAVESDMMEDLSPVSDGEEEDIEEEGLEGFSEIGDSVVWGRELEFSAIRDRTLQGMVERVLK
ncbi:hypothetical protein GQ43DRAFT_466029 [Delitschia confertaspora ATCC 74209]|uniref:CAP-Gly domain-containing protein n=1 Tax=Delitschia confertaspora ATCC 74209 TaxID=1513339 RepID=A0A9P4JJN1_9PLEO|nr:hypothetical protein GQ43DRAFT_466029 [Delitschia confertaspora ATCC 74209]